MDRCPLQEKQSGFGCGEKALYAHSSLPCMCSQATKTCAWHHTWPGPTVERVACFVFFSTFLSFALSSCCAFCSAVSAAGCAASVPIAAFATAAAFALVSCRACDMGDTHRYIDIMRNCIQVQMQVQMQTRTHGHSCRCCLGLGFR